VSERTHVGNAGSPGSAARPHEGGFDWRDAGIGATGALVVAAILAGVARAVGRRSGRDTLEPRLS
jgi:hypothetical protein